MPERRRQLRSVSLAVLYFTSLPSPLRSPAPPLNGFRRLGSRQAGNRLSRPRHWLQPTAAPARSSRGYGLLWLRRSRDNRGQEEMATDRIRTISPNGSNPMTSTEYRRSADQVIAQPTTPTRNTEPSPLE